MANLDCGFKAGKIYVNEPRRLSLPRKLPLGNGWRGLVLIGAGVLLYLENWELSLLTFALAVFWSLLAGIIIKWRRILVRQRVLLLLRRGMVSEALALWGEPEPGSLVWWRHLIALFKAGDWREATRRLEAVEAGKERDYLLAAAYLGQNLPVRALALCPPKPQGKWRLLKAQAYFQLGEWKKVLGVLRGGGRLDENQALEWAWLKGASYYFLEQYKPAVKLLGQVAAQKQEAYARSEAWLRDAIAKLDKEE